jgi:hypothetical protein
MFIQPVSLRHHVPERKELVMPGLVPGIHVLLSLGGKNVDGRDPATPRLRRAL